MLSEKPTFLPKKSYRKYCKIVGFIRMVPFLHLLLRRPLHALPPDFPDLLFLYENVRLRKPQCVLEFGSGCSTLIIAQALKENKSGHLYSLDTDRYWTEMTRENLPSTLKSRCTVIHSPADVVYLRGMPMFRHRYIPDVNPDFVYLDGPAFAPGPKSARIAIDILDRQSSLVRGCFILVDGRELNAHYLHEHMTRRHTFVYRNIFFNYVIELTD